MKGKQLLCMGLLFWLGVIGESGALAANFTLNPLSVTFKGRTRSTTVTVLNESKDKLTVQMRLLAWHSDKDGKEVYEPTKDILYFPKIVSIDPNHKRAIRLAFKGPRKLTQEKAYRLYVEEVPVDKPGVTRQGTRFILRIGIPVFVAPEKDKFAWSISSLSLAEGEPRVEINNRSNRHVVPQSITATGWDKAGKELFKKAINGWYLLAESTKSYLIKLSRQECLALQRLTVNIFINDESKEIERKLSPDPGKCAVESKDEPAKKQ